MSAAGGRPAVRERAVRQILVAEHDPRVATYIDVGLRAGGFATARVTRGGEAARIASGSRYDLLVLDQNLPRGGLGVLDDLRGRGDHLPVIVLVGPADPHLVVTAFRHGADDCLAKPFHVDELVARARARLLDRDRAGGGGPVVCAGGVRLDARTRQATVGDRGIDLSSTEHLLAETMMRRAGLVLTREELLSHVWGPDADATPAVVDVYIRYLRRKLGAATIETVRDVGYRFRR